MSNVLAPICFPELQKELVEGRREILKYISDVQDCNFTVGYVQMLSIAFYLQRYNKTFYLFESTV
jgi:hypothetical protein